MLRLPRTLTFAVIAALPALGLTAGLSSAASASTAGTAASRYAAAKAEALAIIKHLHIGQHGTDHSVSVRSSISGLTQVQSTNWSGYADTGSNFSKATGNWTEPSVSCTSTTSYAAFWVGIDGFSSGSVEQDGTLIECSGGRAFQFSWWEMYPTNSVQTVGSSVASGDSIAASVVRSGTTYTLKVTDSTHTANSFTTSQSCSNCANSSAEWIAEAPCCTSSGGILPLANFGTWNESGATVTEGSTSGVISSFTDDELTMVDSSGAVKAQPGSLNSTGNGFSVTFKRST